MSDTQEPDENDWPNPKLVREIIECRQAVSENLTLTYLLTYYKGQVSDLELQISDLKAKLTAKDHELSLYKSKSTLKSQGNILDPNTTSLLSSKSDRNEILSAEETTHLNLDYLTLQNDLLNQKEANFKSLAEIERLQKKIENYEKTSNHFCNRPTEELVLLVQRLVEENEELKGKNNETRSTAHKTFNSSEVKSGSMLFNDTESASIAESTPRGEEPIPAVKEICFNTGFFAQNFNKRFENPEPPKTRCQLNAPQKVLHSRKTKVVSCDLTEILKSPPKYKSLAEFCPSFKRKFK
jgi:hypothetical protein